MKGRHLDSERLSTRQGHPSNKGHIRQVNSGHQVFCLQPTSLATWTFVFCSRPKLVAPGPSASCLQAPAPAPAPALVLFSLNSNTV